MVKVVALIPDLFFATRAQSVVERSGGAVMIVGTLDELRAACDGERPDLVLVDLAARGVDAGAAIRAAKERGAEVIAFGPHKDLAARATALEAGADEWVTNQRLLEVVRERAGDRT
ncbi:MAG TPA: response regulator [Chloroflexota bacterium]|nr:response regulator [Chloroflexota bacterium]